MDCPICYSDDHTVLGRGDGRSEWRRCRRCGSTYLHNPDRTPQQGIRRKSADGNCTEING